MTMDRDLDRLLGAYVRDGATHAPDRVLLNVSDRIATQRQRPAWVVGRGIDRPTPSTRTVALLAASAVLIGIVGTLLASVAGPGPTPTLTPAPSAPPSDPPVVLLEPTSNLTPGRYLVRTNAGASTFSVPSGWTVTSMGMLDYALAPSGAPDGDDIRVFFDMHIASKDEACTEVPEPRIAMTADAIVANLAADPRIVTSQPVAVTIGGLTGQQIDVRIAPSTTKTCPFSGGTPAVPLLVDDAAYVVSQDGPDITNGPFWGVDPDDRLRIVVLDTPGSGNVVFVVNSNDGTTFDQIVSAAMPVLESYRFE